MPNSGAIASVAARVGHRSIYLLDLIEPLDHATFIATLMRGAGVAAVVFSVFAVGRDAFHHRPRHFSARALVGARLPILWALGSMGSSCNATQPWWSVMSTSLGEPPPHSLEPLRSTWF